MRVYVITLYSSCLWYFNFRSKRKGAIRVYTIHEAFKPRRRLVIYGGAFSRSWGGSQFVGYPYLDSLAFKTCVGGPIVLPVSVITGRISPQSYINLHHGSSARTICWGDVSQVLIMLCVVGCCKAAKRSVACTPVESKFRWINVD